MTRNPSPRRTGLLTLFSAAKSLEEEEGHIGLKASAASLMDHQSPRESPHYVRVRIANACDACKVRKGMRHTILPLPFLNLPNREDVLLMKSS